MRWLRRRVSVLAAVLLAVLLPVSIMAAPQAAAALPSLSCVESGNDSAAGPVVGAIMIGALVVNTGIEVNDMVADATGHNFIKDTVCSGNAACYTGIEIGGAVLGMVGPTGAAGAAKAAEAAADAEKAAKAAVEAEKVASAATDAEKAATAAADANKVTDAASTTKLEDAACALRSFTAATMVLMADGTRKPIFDVQVGDQVTSYDPGTGEQSVQTVTATWPHTDTVVTLTLGDGTVVETTASHPWWDVTTRTYTRTDHLAMGDQLLTADGSTLTVAGMSGPQGEQPVYNLTITGPHTFYVGDDTILVHNVAPCPPIKPGSSGGDSAGKPFSASTRQQALEENPDTCVYCHQQTSSPQVDHATPKAQGGDATIDNAQTTCPHCNASKGARDVPVTPPEGYSGAWPPSWWPS